ncbi:MAG: sugar transferase [Clostridia bacterium]|nr:sugar transferase [Clostridia bacterium]
MYRRFFKRFFDIVLSFIGILVFAIPMVIIAIAVRCDSKGPAIFKTERVGKNCKPFRFYKFRSMTTEAPKDCAPRLLNSDAYITKVGRFLRKTSLDELPQLFCIFAGGMSIIGPRPCGFSEQDLIDARNKYGANSVRPGLTGLAQINGRDILAQNVEKKAWFDGEYVKKITFWGDVKIFFKTIGKVLKRDGIQEGTAASTAEAEADSVPVAESEPVLSVNESYGVNVTAGDVVEIKYESETETEGAAKTA